MVWDFMPLKVRDYSSIGQMHFPIRHFPEKMRTILGANGDEIRPIPAIIPPIGPGRRNAVFVLVFFHAKMKITLVRFGSVRFGP